MKRVMIGAGAIACAALGWLCSTAEHQAHAQVTPPVAAKVSDWIDVGEANGVQAWRFTDSGHVCYVTSSGGISCGR